MVLQCIISSKEEKKMRKFVQIMLLACLVIFSTQVAFANADKATVQEGADLTDVHRLAIASPLYMPRKDAPSKDELLAIMNKASSFARCYVLSYDMVAEEIQKDNGIDIRALDISFRVRIRMSWLIDKRSLRSIRLDRDRTHAVPGAHTV